MEIPDGGRSVTHFVICSRSVAGPPGPARYQPGVGARAPGRGHSQLWLNPSAQGETVRYSVTDAGAKLPIDDRQVHHRMTSMATSRRSFFQARSAVITGNDRSNPSARHARSPDESPSRRFSLSLGDEFIDQVNVGRHMGQIGAASA